MKLPIDLTVVVYFSPFVNLRDKSWTPPPLLAPPSEGKTSTLETDEGTKVNDHGKSMFCIKIFIYYIKKFYKTYECS